MHPINSAWELAQNAARFWRDVDTDLLVVFLAVELVLAAFSEIPSDWSPWNPPNKFRMWLTQHSSVRHILTVIAAFMIVVGVVIETREGDKADHFADLISASLEEYIVSVLPRSRVLAREEERVVSALKPFAGQRIAVMTYQPKNDSKIWGEDVSFGFAVARMLDKAGWLNPSGKPFMEPQGKGSSKLCDNCLLEIHANWSGMFVEIDPHASESARKAAKALGEVFGNNRLQAGWTSSFPLPPPFTNDPSIVVLVIGEQ